MILQLFALSVIAGMMLAELRLSRRNEAELRGRGALEAPGDPYAAMAVAYPAAFLLMGAEGLMRGVAPGAFVAGVLLFAAAKVIKYWAIGSLGSRWSFRVLVLPAMPLVTDGPYRYIAHPNYVGVVGELAGTAMMMQAWVTGPIAIAGFGAVLWRRVRVETRALEAAYEIQGQPAPRARVSK
jgi:methyltransferase